MCVQRRKAVLVTRLRPAAIAVNMLVLVSPARQRFLFEPSLFGVERAYRPAEEQETRSDIRRRETSEETR
jgi:hypothetical protein